MNRRLAALIVLLVAVCGLATVALLVPEYLRALGFPLDAAWTHAVIARSLAQSGELAYNPGAHAPRVASPLWAMVLAVAHLITAGSSAFVLAAKLTGFALHAAASLLLLYALSDRGCVRPEQLAGCALVAFHPDLISASLSGVEVPLATLIASGLLIAATRARVTVYALLSVLAALTCPGLSALAVALPVALLIRRDRHQLLRLVTGAVAGNALAYGTLIASGVAGFGFASASNEQAGIQALVTGFNRLLARLAVADSSLLLVFAMLIALRVILSRDPAPGPVHRAAAAMLGGLVFCAVSFVAFPPLDPNAFAFQYHTLPALPFLVGAVPLLLCYTLRRLLPAWPARLTEVALVALLVLSLVVTARLRYVILAGDARTVDDVQVAIGRHLASSRSDDVVWAVGGGAVRYFGNAFVVDVSGVNSAAMLGPDAQTFLDQHRPRYIEVAPRWSAIQAGYRLESLPFQALTPYPATSFEPAPPHWIAVCDDPAVSGRVVVRGRPFAFHCARPSPSLPSR
jgi:hypothetical protein